MESAEIVRRFLRFFEERGHAVVPSANLIAEDPTLLLVNAGMVPFKPFFLGQRQAPYRRATSAQKCVRTVDIDEVGKTTRHASFFQMLGNFAFGDYFKEWAIPYAWELLTLPESQGGFGFSGDKLWVTVYTHDEEAASIWRDTVGLPEHRIQRRGMADNFWSMGVPGPCGPCSEIYYDRGPEHGQEGGPLVDEERYLEIWNLVFMESERGEGSGKDDFPILGDLPSKNIDTGMGLERMAAVLQGVDNIYEIDTTWMVLDRAAELTGHAYGADAHSDVSLRVIADHVRTATMLVGDGVLPSNEGRGYVLRRILRRSVRNLRLLGAGEQGAIHDLVAATIDAMSPTYPDLAREVERIHAVMDAEESSFLSTLRTGTSLFDTVVEETRRNESTTLSGEQAFILHDTYGFPIDLTLEMASEQGFTVDEEGFRSLMEQQRRRAKEDAAARKAGQTDLSAYRQVLDDSGESQFLGYSQTVAETRLAALLVNGAGAPVAGEGEEVEVVLDRTPFYAEGGGQLADQGRLRLSNGAEIDVVDVQSPVPGLIVHRAKVRKGEAYAGLEAQAEIDTERRRAISRSHSATHLVHAGVRRALGESAAQAGSENSPGRFRFDFTSPGAVSTSMLRDVEDEVNTVLAEDHDVHAFVTSLAEARDMGAVAMFGEKYGDEVRVVEIGDYSRELCGGTHVTHSGQLGLIKLMGESSIGAGVRRVEALVGVDAFRFLARESLLVSQVSEQLKVRKEELPERIEQVVTRLRDTEKELEHLRAAQVLQAAGSIADQASDVAGASFVGYRVPDGTSTDDARKLALDVRSRLEPGCPGVVVLASLTQDRPVAVVATNDKAREAGLKAGELVGVAARVLGGGGGGKDDVAQGGGSRPEAIDEALETARQHVGHVLTGGV